MILLPVATRYEQEGGGTETTTERRIVFSPELPATGRRGPQRVAALRRRGRTGPARPAPARSPGPTNQALRAEIAEVVPAYAGIEDLATTGDQVQWGGRHLCADGTFPTPDGRGRFTPLVPECARPPRRRLHRGDPAGQAVQLHGPRRGRSAHRAPRATPSTSTRPTPPRWARSRARGCASPATPARSTAGSRWCACPAAASRCTGPRATCSSAAAADAREPRSKVPDYNAVVVRRAAARLGPVRGPPLPSGHARTARAHRRVGRPPPVLQGRSARRGRRRRRRGEGRRGRRRPGRAGRHARPQGRRGVHGPGPRPVAAAAAADRAGRGRPRRGRQLRVAHRAVGVRPGRARRDEGGPPAPERCRRRARRRSASTRCRSAAATSATGSRCPTTTARS